jgi:hypothetical protein
VEFVRQDNIQYVTETKGTYLCDSNVKVLQDWVNRPEKEFANIYIVYQYPEIKKKWALIQKDELDRAIILAFDIDKDGLYDYLMFDTDMNGYLDMELKGGHATAEEVLWLYCQYHRLEMS